MPPAKARAKINPCARTPVPTALRNIIAQPACAPQQTVATFQLNRSFDVANRAHIASRTVAVMAIATTRESDARIALSTLIIAVSLVLLPGAVWMHAT